MLLSVPYLLIIGCRSLGWFALALAEDVVFGLITRAIMKSKNREGGFGWGFFLGGIGIIVCATKRRIVYDAPSRPVYSYLSDPAPKKEEKKAEPLKPASWKCGKCGKENGMECNFCIDCGERRHYPWKCASCAKENAPEVRFCPQCGNARSDEQEKTPGEMKPEENFLSDAEQMAGAAEIAAAFSERYGMNPDENIQAMAQLLEKIKKYNSNCMNTKKMAIDHLQAFFKNDMQVYKVDRSQLSITCPVCGKVQNNAREKCFNCGALFRD